MYVFHVNLSSVIHCPRNCLTSPPGVLENLVHVSLLRVSHVTLSFRAITNGRMSRSAHRSCWIRRFPSTQYHTILLLVLSLLRVSHVTLSFRTITNGRMSR